MATLKTDLQAYYAERAEQYEEIYAREERQDDLDELQDRIATGMSHDHPVPFYRMLHKRFVREML